jgi:transglutaminase-like putative cysteine protease
MELYRLLRISIYLTAASGALALAIAEGDVTYFVAMVGMGCVSYFMIDQGRLRPLPVQYALMIQLGLLIYTFWSLRATGETGLLGPHFYRAAAHSICVFQMVLFFTNYRGAILLTFCGSSLVVVLISGIIHPGISLILRMACFVAVTAWTLFIHSLWRSEENYHYHSSSSSSSSSEGSVKLDKTFQRQRVGQKLDARAFKQGIGLVLGLSAGCLLLGSLFFVFMPRINETLTAMVDNWLIKRDSSTGLDLNSGKNPDTLKLEPPENPTMAASVRLGAVKGWSESVNYKQQGPMAEDTRAAYAIRIRSMMPGLASPSGRVYLRGLALSTHQSLSGWIPDRNSLETFESTPNALDGIEFRVDPSNPVAQTTSLIQIVVTQKVAQSKVFFALGSVSRLKGTALFEVQQDKEGSLWKTSSLDRYEVSCYLPIFPEDIDLNARAEHSDYNRYVNNHGLGADFEEIKRLAHSIVTQARAQTALQKVRAIQKFLQDPTHFSYTLKLENLTLRQFLLEEGKHKGHCGYFSTAFVLLCRMNNIPARIATGFVADVTSEQLQRDELTIEFRNSDAHACCEVFFKNSGWVTFDPTPPAFRTSIKEELAENDWADNFADQGDELPSDERDILTKAWSRVLDYNSQDQRDIFHRISSSLGAGLGGAKNVLRGQSNGGWILAVSVWLGVGALMYLLLTVFLRRGRRGRSASPQNTARSRAAVSFYNELQLVLSRRGFVRRAGQTPHEFAEQVVRRGGVPFLPVRVITTIFEQVRYGNFDISQDDFNKLQHAMDTLRELTFVSATPAPRN